MVELISKFWEFEEHITSFLRIFDNFCYKSIINNNLFLFLSLADKTVASIVHIIIYPLRSYRFQFIFISEYCK